MKSLILGKTILTIAGPWLKVEDCELPEKKVFIRLTLHDVNRLVAYKPTSNPNRFKCSVIQHISEDTFCELSLWTDKQDRVFISAVDHRPDKQIWVETDHINIDQFKDWIRQ